MLGSIRQRISAGYDSDDTVRFYSVRLRESGVIRAAPTKILAEATDWGRSAGRPYPCCHAVAPPWSSRLIPGNTGRTEWQTRPWRPFALLAANACRHRLVTPPLASTIQIGTTERWAPRVLFPTRDLAKGVAMAPSEKALQIVALQR